MVQICGRKRPHGLGGAWLPGVPPPVTPWAKSRPAHCFLKTPPAGPPPAALGQRAVARSPQEGGWAPAVGGPGDADRGIAGIIEPDPRLMSQPGHELLDVLDLV